MGRVKRQGPYKNCLKKIREKINLTQEELAERLKMRGFSVSAAYVSQIEAGLKNISLSLAMAICEEVGYNAIRITEIFLPEYFTGSAVNQKTNSRPEHQ